MNFQLKNTNEFLGQILRDWRRKKRISLEALSRKTEGEVSSRHLRRIEAGQVSSTYETFSHIRRGLGVTTTEMFLPYFLFEDQIPLFPARSFSGSPLLSVRFTHGRTCAKYQVEEDPDCYAIQLQEEHGLIGAGSILHMSPNAPLEEGCLVLAVRSDGAAQLCRWINRESVRHIHEPRFIHRVIRIQPR